MKYQGHEQRDIGSVIPDRPDASAVTVGSDVVFDEHLRTVLTQNLAAFPVIAAPTTALKKAAVALCVGPNGDGMASVLLTLRPATLNRHAGQYALPGGRLDAGETDQQAAIREVAEELSLTIKPDHVLGRLDDFETASGYRIAPLVFWVEDTTAINPNPEEVAAVFHIPFAELLSPDIPHIAPDAVSGDAVLSAPLGTVGHHVFAPTAALLYQFREVAILRRWTRVADAGQPDFARR